jgi:HEPN domain-containing protein
MPPDRELVRQWLERANADLRAATVLAADPSLSSEACFHCQQAVEKALKAYLTFKGSEFEYVHAIAYLTDLCAEQDDGFDRFRDLAEPLTRYAVGFRYPRSSSDPNPRETKDALVVAEQICRFVLDRLPPQVYPTA